MTKRKIILIGIVLVLLFPLFASVFVKAEIITLRSYKKASPPTIDGSFTNAEWSDAYHTSFFHEPDSIYNHPNDYIHIYIKNSQDKLYLLFDILPDNTSENDDFLNIYFDCNYDDIIDNNITMNLRRDHAPDSVLGNQIVHWIMGFGISPNKDKNHSILELAINITFSSAYDGSSRPNEMNYTLPVGNANETIRIIFDAVEHFSDWVIPQNGDYIDPTTYADLLLNRVPSNVPFGTPLLIGTITIIAIAATIMQISRKIKYY